MFNWLTNWLNREREIQDTVRCIAMVKSPVKSPPFTEQRQCLNVTRNGRRCWQHE
jgi:hypothetical protein